jgi:hypothetical protein
MGTAIQLSVSRLPARSRCSLHLDEALDVVGAAGDDDDDDQVSTVA